jgi:hypothetical protein
MAPTDLLRITESDADGDSISQRVERWSYVEAVMPPSIVQQVRDMSYSECAIFDINDAIIVFSRIRPKVAA